VGAASTTALELSDGSVIIIDAGVNTRGIGTTQAALEALVVQRLETFIGAVLAAPLPARRSSRTSCGLRRYSGW
jgi:hypothetical protein